MRYIKRSLVTTLVLLGITAAEVQASYMNGLYPQLSSTLAVGLMTQRDRLQLVSTLEASGQQASSTFEFPLEQVWAGFFSLDYDIYADSRISVFTRQKFDQGKGLLTQTSWNPFVQPSTQVTSYTAKVDEAYAYGAQFTFNAFSWPSATGIESIVSVLAGYEFEWLRVLNGAVVANNSLHNISPYVYRNRTASGYIGARYDATLGPWAFALEGAGSGWSAVDAKLFYAVAGQDFHGRFRDAKTYWLNTSLGYEFFPAWMFQLGYLGEYIPKATGAMAVFQNGIPYSGGGSTLSNIEFRRYQHFFSFNLEGTF